MRFYPVYLSIGSNMGNRQKNLRDVLSWINESSDIRITRVSSVYETEPLYNKDQNNFYNLVAEMETDYEPEELLIFLKSIESKMGRQMTAPRYSARVIDIDILFFGNKIVRANRLTIPHVKLYERQFVLAPLSEINHTFVCPKTKKNVAQLLKECKDVTYIEKIRPISVPETGYLNEV